MRTNRKIAGVILVAGCGIGIVTGAGQLPDSKQGSPPSMANRQGVEITRVVNETMGLAASTVQNLAITGTVGARVTTTISIDDQTLTLELTPYSVRAPNYELKAQLADGSIVNVDPGPIRTLRGRVLGIPGSIVAGSVLTEHLYAIIVLPAGDKIWVEPIGLPIAGAAQNLYVIYHNNDVLPTGASCGLEIMRQLGMAQQIPLDVEENEAARGEGICVAELANDADVEYFNDYGSVTAVQDRIAMVTNVVNIQYENEVGITHLITTTLVRTSEPDPYDRTDSTELLCQFINEWTNNQSAIQRDVAQLFTGKSIADETIGQAAEIGSICNPNGCSTFPCICGVPFGTRGSYCFVESDFNGVFACATDLSAHELGHLWSAQHCSCLGFTMHRSIQGANTFHPAFTVPDIVAYRNTLSCLGNCPPSVTMQPTGQVICKSEEVTFCVDVAGTEPFSYQWRKDGIEIPGATSSCYTILSVAPGDAGDYTCEISNPFGSDISSAATLTLAAPPTITTDPSSQATCLGSSVTFDVVAAGDPPLSYQWRMDSLDIPGATESTYTIDEVVQDDAGDYDVIIANPCGTVTSNVGTLEVSQTFPPAGLDDFTSQASFKVVMLDGDTVDIIGLEDEHTIVGRSDPFEEGTELPTGVEIFGAGPNGDYPDTLLRVADPCVFPEDFPESPDARREVHTEILSLNLTNGFSSVRAGQAYFDSVQGTAREAFYRNSIGEVASLSPEGVAANDFPADSFFNMFVEAEAPLIGKLYNRTPMVVSAEIDCFPPDLDLPDSQYIHDPNFGAVPLYNDIGLQIGFLISAGHGGDASGGGGVGPGARIMVDNTNPVTYAVNTNSLGLDPLDPDKPNHVQQDAGSAVQQVTAYQSSGAALGAGPDITNARVPDLVGDVGSPPQEFAAGDAINSFSFGRDGTYDPIVRRPNPGILFFSVDRSTIGQTCTAVWFLGGDLIIRKQQPRQAAAVFVAGVDRFGLYVDKSTARAPSDSNTLAVDATALGLRPLLLDTSQDDVTALEISGYAPGPDSGLFYATFTGPSFVAPGDSATIWVYDPALGAFNRGNLRPFAVPVDLGLDPGDVIDALVLSDVSVSECPTPCEAPCWVKRNGEMDRGRDEVLFSLAPGSPSLATGGYSAADIFHSKFEETVPLTVRNDAASLGLLDSDNVDAADIRPAPQEQEVRVNELFLEGPIVPGIPPKMICNQVLLGAHRDVEVSTQYQFNGVPDVIVHFTIPTGGFRWTSGPTWCDETLAVVKTNANGRASVSFVADEIGPATIKATVLENGLPLSPTYLLFEIVDNDQCIGAEQQSVPSSICGVTRDPAPICTPDGAPDCFDVTDTVCGVWYSVTGNGNEFTASVCHANTTYDTALSVYTNGCAGLQCVAANDVDPDCTNTTVQSTVEWCSHPGQEYLILVHGSGSANNTGHFNLELTQGAPCGACCFADGSCQFLTGDDCTDALGTFFGGGTDCDLPPCPGACCFGNGSCQNLSESVCEFFNGDFQGAGTACVPNPCPPPPLLGDIDGDGDIDSNDTNLFIAVLLGTDTDPAHVTASDCNGDGAADGKDIQVFVSSLAGP